MEQVIKSKCFLEVPFLIFLALYTKRKRCGQMGPILCYSQSQVVSECQKFWPVAPFFSGKTTIFVVCCFLNTERDVAI